MTQIYVVCKQADILADQPMTPVAAYNDYPSALAYAGTIFQSQFGSDMSARDLVFMVALTPTAASTASSLVSSAIAAAIPSI